MPLTGEKGIPGKVGLEDGSTLPVGVPIPWPLSNAPAGWLKYNGAAFDKTQYPKLAAVYPAGVLPDLRGEFIRGWDDGRGVDAGRAILTWQKGTINTNDPNITSINVASPILANDNSASAKTEFGLDSVQKNDYANIRTAFYTSGRGGDMDDNGYAGGYGSTRPRNTAFNYIVRAA